MGGCVGLKGTDGDIYKKAIKMGATPVTPIRANELLSNVKNKEKIILLVAPGKMGADIVKDLGIDFEIIGEIGTETTEEDTKRIAKQMVEKNIDLIIFCGGDGTARDIFDSIGLEKPVVALPAGVKMFSSVFAINPRAAAEIIDKFIEGTVETQEKEVLDINEDLFRKDILQAKLYGYLKVPKVLNLIQSGKTGSGSGRTIEENKQDIAQFMIENMEDDILYLLGPGTTIKTITDNLNLPKTLLGIDAIYDNKIIGRDLNEKAILELLNKYKKTIIIISPVGGQGFIFGRGNKQITPRVLRKVGKNNIKIIATTDKMRELVCLRVDTGNIEIDKMLIGFGKVITGYKEELIVKIE
ncbi:MAG: ATP-NAD kinase family protein [Candidatus Lokiarchaeota archaeon]|nr:ATP-NAD kinase family protein [Candidatus Lokiarchaeota archaeon]